MDESDHPLPSADDRPSTSDGALGRDDATPTAAPSDSVRVEIIAFLNDDQSALGDVWRRTQGGETPADIQAARGTVRKTFVWSYLRVCRALVDGDLPTAPTVALQVARRYRSILSDGILSRD